MTKPNFIPPFAVHIDGYAQQDVESVYRRVLAVGLDGQRSRRGYFVSSGTWIADNRLMGDQAVVHLDRHGALRGAFADARMKIRSSTAGGCQISISGWVPKRVWLSNLGLFVFIWGSRFYRQGWTSWMAKETVLFLIVYALFVFAWRRNLSALVGDMRRAASF